MPTIREQILQNIEQKLAIITQANGYEITVGSVNRRQDLPGQNVNMPSVSIVEGEEVKEEQRSNQWEFLKLPIAIRVFDHYGNDDKSVHVNKIIGAIKKAMMSDMTCGGLASTTRYQSTSPIFDFNGDGGFTVGVALVFDVTYFCKLDDPYAQ